MLSVAAGTQPLREVLHWGVTTLQDADIETARLDAEVLLATVLNVTRAQLIARLRDSVGRTERIAYRGCILRRAQDEPVAYIVGHRDFYGRRFHVDRRVLIPRPETELLVERALDVLASHTDPTIVDVGTGSGIIAVTLTAERPDLHAIAIDTSAGALEVAKLNAGRHDVGDRISFLQGDLLEPLERPVDLIAANLPYVGTEESVPHGITAYEPHVALFAGTDGLDLIRVLLDQIGPDTLLPAGTVLLEIGSEHGRVVAAIAREHFPDATVTVRPDLGGRDRLVEIQI